MVYKQITGTTPQKQGDVWMSYLMMSAKTTFCLCYLNVDSMFPVTFPRGCPPRSQTCVDMIFRVKPFTAFQVCFQQKTAFGPLGICLHIWQLAEYMQLYPRQTRWGKFKQSGRHFNARHSVGKFQWFTLLLDRPMVLYTNKNYPRVNNNFATTTVYEESFLFRFADFCQQQQCR